LLDVPSLNMNDNGIDRRRFLQLMGASLALVGGGCGAHFLDGIPVEGYVRHRRCSRASRSTWAAGLVTEAPALIS